MDRHAARHGGPPGGVGASVEGRVEFDRLQRAVGIAAHARLDRRGMALGARHHALGPLVDAGDRRAGEPGGKRRERLDRDVELAAEAAAAGARHDPHLRWREAQHLGGRVAVHHRRLGRDEELHPLAQAPRPAGLGLDVGVLDEGGLEAPFGGHRAARERRPGVAALDPTLDELVALGLFVDQGGAQRAGVVQAVHRRERLVADRQVFVAHRRDRLARANERHHRIAPVAHDAFGEHRLVAQVGIDADAVVGHVGGCEHPFQARPGGGFREVAEGDPRRVMGRADDAEPERVCRHGIGAVTLGTGELGHAVELGEPGAHGGTGRGRAQGLRRIARRVQHRRHDLAIACAAAEHTAEAVQHFRRTGAWGGAQQLGRGDQHARRAGAALRRAVAQESPLQAVQPSFGGKALHGLHVAPGGLGQRHHAATHLGAVEQHRAGAAVAGVAADLGPGQAEIVAKRIGEAPERRRVHRHRPAIDQERSGAVPGRPRSHHAPEFGERARRQRARGIEAVGGRAPRIVYRCERRHVRVRHSVAQGRVARAAGERLFQRG